CIKEYCQTIHVEHITTPTTCTLQPYPNPAGNTVSVNLSLSQPQMINVFIYNSMNVMVRERHQQGVAGSNIVTVDVGDLVAGTYTMKVIYGNSICYAMFQKL